MRGENAVKKTTLLGAPSASVLALTVPVLVSACDEETAPGGPGSEVSEGKCADAPSELALEFTELPIEGASGATDFSFFPESDEILVTTRDGRLIHARVETGGVGVIDSWEFQEDVVPEQACGATNVIFDPEFEDNSFIYVTYCLGDMAVTQLVRYQFSPETGPTDPAVIFETTNGHESEPWHRFGSLGFEEDGETLWMYSGDQFDRDNGQDPSGPEGALLRIVPNREPGGAGHDYPDGNMADSVGEPGEGMGGGPSFEEVHPAVYVYGLRSPWRGTRDESGRFFIGDVGLGAEEEVNVATEAGQNFGWGIHEGPCVDDCDGFVDPVAYYGREADHPYIADDPETEAATKRAIWMGEIYQSPGTDRYCGLMDDMVVFGDLFTGWVRGLRVDQDGAVTFDESIGHLTNVTQWRVGTDGFAYALGLDGTLFRATLVLDSSEGGGGSKN